MNQFILKKFLRYDPASGVFYRLSDGKKAGSRKGRYYRIGVGGKLFYAHRLAFLYMTGKIPALIDHINRNGRDCRWANLRATTRSQNALNTQKTTANTSGYRGVSKTRNGKWHARIRINNRNIHLGYYTSKIKAIQARKKAGSFVV